MKIAVIGATGGVGSAAAFYIAAERLAEEIVLVGRRENIVQHHAIDLATAVAPQRVTVRAGRYEDIEGSDLVINAAGMHQDLTADRTEMLVRNVGLIRDIALEIRRYCPDAVVITATNPVDALNYATWRAGGFERHQLIGYSLNDSLRFREYVAKAKGVEVDQVDGVVIGEHGTTQVPLFSSVRVDGRSVPFTEDEKESIRGETPAFFKRLEGLKAGRTAAWTCAVGLAAFSRAVADDTGEMLPSSAILDGEYGQHGLSMGAPLVLGRSGIRTIVERELASDEVAGLERTVAQLRATAEIVDGALGQ